MRAFCTLLASTLVTVNILAAQPPYGLNPPSQPLGAYLNGKFPASRPSVGYSLQRVYSNIGFDRAVLLTPYPTIPGNTQYQVVVQHNGIIKMFPDRANVQNGEVTNFLNLYAFTDQTPDEDAGMTSVAFHPKFSEGTRYVFVMYKWRPAATNITVNPDGQEASCPYCTTNPPRNRYAYIRLSRFEVDPGHLEANPASEKILIQQLDRHVFHDAGCLMFGQDGYLYFSIGDEGSADDCFDVTQNISKRLLSGIFRIDVDMYPANHPSPKQPDDPASKPPASTGWSNSYTMSGRPGFESQSLYYIPANNPFVGVPGALEEYYALGLRNAFKFSQDPLTGKIWIGDVGQEGFEEIDVIEPAYPGRNYQWPYKEGNNPYKNGGNPPNPLIGVGIGSDKERAPLWSYPHSGGGCIIGGMVYRGSQNSSLPRLKGKYVFGDVMLQQLRSLEDVPGGSPVQEVLLYGTGWLFGGITSITLDRSGDNIYLMRYNTGEIYKLVETPTGPLLKAKLSETGAFQTNGIPASPFPPTGPLVPTAGLIPYSVNSPLWSDGARKNRWIAVPFNGTQYTSASQITFSITNEWQFKPGTVFVKHFELPTDENNPSVTERLETRFLVMDQSSGAYGVTYKWNSAGTDADLVESSGTSESINMFKACGANTTSSWNYPSWNECMSCHNSAAGYVLGVKTHQLNGDFFYTETKAKDNQLRAWNHIGIFGNLNPQVEFETQVPGAPKSYAVTNTSVSLELRTRSYIAANCAQCHRPGGPASQGANFDARYSTALGNQNIIDGQVLKDLGLGSSARVVAPGDLAHSVMYIRDNSLNAQIKMPPLAKNRIDEEAMLAMAAWINSLNSGGRPAVTIDLIGLGDNKVVTGPFDLHVQFSVPVTGLDKADFAVTNGEPIALLGSGRDYTLTVRPTTPGEVTIQLPAGSVTENNYISGLRTFCYKQIDSDMLTWLPLNDGSGSLAIDASGHNNHGTLLPGGFGPTWTPGKFGTGLAFDGADDYAEISNLIGEDFTICCWIKTSQIFAEADLTQQGTGLIWSDVAGYQNDFVLGATRKPGGNGPNRLSFLTGNPDTALNGATEISSGQWAHVAATRKRSTGEMKIYVNGQLDGTAQGGTGLLTVNPKIHIGGNTLDNHYYQGTMDDVRLYDRVVTEAEIQSLMFQPRTSPPPAPTITWATNGISLFWPGQTNEIYQVQWSPSLNPADWQTFTNSLTSIDGWFSFLDNGTQTGGAAKERYYRLVRLQ